MTVEEKIKELRSLLPRDHADLWRALALIEAQRALYESYVNYETSIAKQKALERAERAFTEAE